MPLSSNTNTGRFVWVDLAAADAARAASFYCDLFGWSAHSHHVGGGQITRFRLDGADVASLYQLQKHHLARGVPSHWTPYVAVESADAAASKVTALSGRIIVKPFDVAGLARVSLVQDPVGGLFGLWQHEAQSPTTRERHSGLTRNDEWAVEAD